jgi:hypothetical protein
VALVVPAKELAAIDHEQQVPIGGIRMEHAGIEPLARYHEFKHLPITSRRDIERVITRTVPRANGACGTDLQPSANRAELLVQ